MSFVIAVMLCLPSLITQARGQWMSWNEWEIKVQPNVLLQTDTLCFMFPTSRRFVLQIHSKYLISTHTLFIHSVLCSPVHLESKWMVHLLGAQKVFTKNIHFLLFFWAFFFITGEIKGSV